LIIIVFFCEYCKIKLEFALKFKIYTYYLYNIDSELLLNSLKTNKICDKLMIKLKQNIVWYTYKTKENIIVIEQEKIKINFLNEINSDENCEYYYDHDEFNDDEEFKYIIQHPDIKSILSDNFENTSLFINDNYYEDD